MKALGTVPRRCLSGRAGTTHAGKSRTRWSRRNTKSWKRLLEDGLGVENIGRFVYDAMNMAI